MDIKFVIEIVSMVIGGLGVFLLGMKNMSEGLQAVSGEGLRKMISAVTNNRLLGVAVGILVTCLVQSSSVTTVMVVGFVNSGIMNLMQAIGVIFGANVGTTITGWILVLKIGKFGLPILGVAAIFFLFSKKERIRYIGMTVMGIGMVFFGLELMKNGFKPLASHEEFKAWFQLFHITLDGNLLATYLGVAKCAAIGMVLTMIVQSSSATLGITIGLAATGLIEFPTAAALVMGENIGTTVTAPLASLGTTTTAKRTAYAHFFFNVIGTTWFIAMFPIAIHGVCDLIAWRTGYDPTSISLADIAAVLYPTLDATPILADIAENAKPLTAEGLAVQGKYEQIITAGIALTHTTFNVANVLLFLPFAGALAKFVTMLAPEKVAKESQHLTYLDIRLADSPELGIVQSEAQIGFMAERVTTMMADLKNCLSEPVENSTLESSIYHAEEELDVMQKEIFLFLGSLASGVVSQDVAHKIHIHLRVADEYESLSDYVVNMLKRNLKLQKNHLQLDGDEKEKLLKLHDSVAHYLAKVNEMATMPSQELLAWATSESIVINKTMKAIRHDHLEKLRSDEVSPFFSLAYTDMLNYYRRMKDHALNIAEASSGEF